MELLHVPALPVSYFTTTREIKPSVSVVPTSSSYFSVKLKRRTSHVPSGLPETAASIAVAAAVVGVAATILMRRQNASQENEIPMRPCEDCSGSGVCSECRGEGFVLRKLSEESAERAILKAKNMATRYTAALPKKWSYCTMCSSARKCRTCGGSGKQSSGGCAMRKKTKRIHRTKNA